MALPAANALIRGVKSPEPFHPEAMKILAGNRRLTYESHEFLLPTPATDFSIVSDLDHVADCSCGRASGFGGIIGRVGQVAIRNVGAGAITFKYNAAEEDPLTLEDGEKHDWDFLEVTDLFFSNTTGAAVGVRVLVT